MNDGAVWRCKWWVEIAGGVGGHGNGEAASGDMVLVVKALQ